MMGMRVKGRAEILNSVMKEGLIEKVPLNRDWGQWGRESIFQAEGYGNATGQKGQFSWANHMLNAFPVFSQAIHTEAWDRHGIISVYRWGPSGLAPQEYTTIALQLDTKHRSVASKSRPECVYWFPIAAITNSHRLGGLNNANLFFYSFVSQNSNTFSPG